MSIHPLPAWTMAFLLASPLASASTIWEDTITALNPAGWWRLNDASLASADDATAAANDGTYKGDPTLLQAPAFDTGTNHSVRFFREQTDPAIGDNISIGDVLDVGAAGEFTIMAWFNATKLTSELDGNASMKVVSKGLTAAGTPASAGYDILLRGDELRARVRDDSGNEAVAAVAEPAKNQWHFVVAVLDRSIDQLLLYLDPLGSSAAATASASLVNSLATNIPLSIGALDRQPIATNTSSISEHFDGFIDEVVFFDRALTGSQIQQAFDAGRSAIPEPATVVLLCLALAGLGIVRRRPVTAAGNPASTPG